MKGESSCSDHLENKIELPHFNLFELQEVCKTCFEKVKSQNESMHEFVFNVTKEMVDQMKKAIKTPYTDDAHLIRFIRGQKGDVYKASKLYDEMMMWRKKEDVDTILEKGTPFTDYSKLIPNAYLPQPDKYGHPIYIEKIGLIDEVYCKTVKPELVVRHHIWHLEKMISLAKSHNEEKIVIILDLKGLTTSKASPLLDVLKATTHIDQSYYPERLFRLFFINAPTSFSTLWSGIKLFLDNATKKKVHIYADSFKPHLLEIISPDVLPQEYGGNSPSPFPQS